MNGQICTESNDVHANINSNKSSSRRCIIRRRKKNYALYNRTSGDDVNNSSDSYEDEDNHYDDNNDNDDADVNNCSSSSPLDRVSLDNTNNNNNNNNNCKEDCISNNNHRFLTLTSSNSKIMQIKSSSLSTTTVAKDPMVHCTTTGTELQQQQKSFSNVENINNNYDVRSDGSCVATSCIKQSTDPVTVAATSDDVIEHHTSRCSNNNWKQTIASISGNILEWYDFAIFGYFSDIIGTVFFKEPSLSNAFLLFGLAFFVRPIGGIFFGYIGDTYSRSDSVISSMTCMAIPTFCIGCLPSYHTIGISSTILLVLIRLLQGFSVGGQLMSSLVYTLECHHPSQWGLYSSLVGGAASFGILLGSAVCSILRLILTKEQLFLWGWRIPFLSGILVSFSAYYLRTTTTTSTKRTADTKVIFASLSSSSSSSPREVLMVVDNNDSKTSCLFQISTSSSSDNNNNCNVDDDIADTCYHRNNNNCDNHNNIEQSIELCEQIQSTNQIMDSIHHHNQNHANYSAIDDTDHHKNEIDTVAAKSNSGNIATTAIIINNRTAAATTITTTSNPLREALAYTNRRSLVAATMVPMVASGGYYLIFVWMAIYMTQLLKDHPVPYGFGINTIVLIISTCIFWPLAGILSDHYGRIPTMCTGGIGLAIGSPPIIRLIQYAGTRHNPYIAFIGQIILGIFVSLYNAPLGAWLVESFEPNVRLTSVAIGYNVANMIAGGMTPYLSTILVHKYNPMAPGWILTVLATVSITGLVLVGPKPIKEHQHNEHHQQQTLEQHHESAIEKQEEDTTITTNNNNNMEVKLRGGSNILSTVVPTVLQHRRIDQTYRGTSTEIV